MFRDLAQASTNVQSLSFDELARYLDSERVRARQPTELLGARIAGSQVVLLGVPTILCLQLYGWLHMIVFKRRIGTAVRAVGVAWIGLYDGWIARGVTIISFFVLPVLAIVVLQWTHLRIGSAVARVSAGAAVVVSVALATVSCVNFLVRVEETSGKSALRAKQGRRPRRIADG